MFVFEQNNTVSSCVYNLKTHPTTAEAFKDVVVYEVEAPQDKEFRDAWEIITGLLGVEVNRLGYNLPKAKVIATAKAKEAASTMMKVVTDEYSQAEIDTWMIQEDEARGNQPDDYLLQLSTHSGVPLVELKAKIIANADAFRALSAESVGRRQKMERACNLASTMEELRAVVF